MSELTLHWVTHQPVVPRGWWTRPRGHRAVTSVLLGALLLPCLVLVLVHTYSDLRVYMSGGAAVLHGQDLYGAAVRVKGYGFTYPPFAALLFSWPSLLPVGVAVTAMTLASLVALVVIVRYSAPDLVRRLYRERSAAVVATVAAMLVCEPVRATLWNGQVNLVLAAMVMYDVLGNRPTRSRGVLIGIAAAIKLTPGIFVVYLVVRGRYREAANAVAAFAVACVLAGVLVPGDSRSFWTHKLFDDTAIGDITRTSNQSLLGVAERLVGPSAAFPVWAVLVVPAAAAGLWSARRVSASGREAFALGIVGITGCVVSPVSWSHHWVWCIPWIAGIAALARTRGPAFRRATLALAALFVGLNLVPRRAIEWWTPSWLVIGNGFVLAAILTFLCAVVGRRPRPCTRLGRVLNRSWHSARLSASRSRSEARSIWAVRRGHSTPDHQACPPQSEDQPNGQVDRVRRGGPSRP